MQHRSIGSAKHFFDGRGPLLAEAHSYIHSLAMDYEQDSAKAEERFVSLGMDPIGRVLVTVFTANREQHGIDFVP